MRLPTGFIVVVSVFLAAAFVVAADDGPTVGELSGEATFLSGGMGEPKPLAKGDELSKGDEITLADGAKMKVDLPEGASMEVSGPASFRLRMVSEFAWTVDLKSGTIDHLVAKDYFTGVSTPVDVYMALRNGDVTVSVKAAKGGGTTVTMLLNEGSEAKVVQSANGGETRKLEKGEPFVFESEPTEAATRAEAVKEAEPAPQPEKKPELGATIRIGVHLVRVVPKDSFVIAQTPGGGWLLTCRAPEGEYCSVTVDHDVNFFLTGGESMEFDSLGNVLRHDAVVHVYAALDIRGIYDEAVANPGDASFVGSTSE